MTNENINAAIAKECGWKGCPRCSDPECAYNVIPNYCNDLNAMHHAEKALNSDHIFQKYYLALYDITLSTRWLMCATASQRAEAFLRTLGLWEEESI
jgi:hypothetical protein